MPAGDMVQIHMLTAYPATLLNRDDAGLAKRLRFGDAVRTRVSSQCLKKHWREAPEITELGDLADRSTRIYERRVAQPLMDEHEATQEEALGIARYLMNETVEAGSKGEEGVQTGQVVVLTRAETDFLATEAARILGEMKEAGLDAGDEEALKKNAKIDRKTLGKQLAQLPASLDTAMFGRMVTSDVFARVDAAVSVAHAFTTHAEAAETDYFTAVDTLKSAEDDAGAGLIQDTELATGVFYTYAVVDMNQLRDNLGDDAERAKRLARNLVRAMATVSPGAKRGSTAPYSYAEFVLLERGGEQPRTLANAFLKAVDTHGADLMQSSVDALVSYRGKVANMYGDSDGDAVAATIHALPAEARLEKADLDGALDRIFGSET